MEISIVRHAQAADREHLAQMWALLWPDETLDEHLRAIDEVLTRGLSGNLPIAILVAQSEENALTGFLEVGLRSHADCCDPSHPVGFVEGWFVHAAFRHHGVGGQLMSAAEAWARAQGCREMASDTWISSEDSQLAHQALGFEIVDRCVHFRKSL
jgi:aminoglycoside 6'-N-acetyltransferase I